MQIFQRPNVKVLHIIGPIHETFCVKSTFSLIIPLEYNDWSVKAIGEGLQIDHDPVAVVSIIWRYYMDDRKNTFLDKCKMCDKLTQRASGLNKVCCKARICFLTSSFFYTFQTVGQPEYSKSSRYRILIVTWLMALLLGKLVPGNCFTYCSLTLLQKLGRKLCLMMNIHYSRETTPSCNTQHSTVRWKQQCPPLIMKGSVVYITCVCSVTNGAGHYSFFCWLFSSEFIILSDVSFETPCT